MIKQLWLNLPVENIDKALAFYTQVGFVLNESFPKNAESACIFAGISKTAIMLYVRDAFARVAGNSVSDTGAGTEILISVDAESKEEVDELAIKAAKAGGTVFGKPTDVHGWMYGCGFIDVDGHRWNVLYMDLSKMPPM